jgi:hypothetical protein
MSPADVCVTAAQVGCGAVAVLCVSQRSAELYLSSGTEATATCHVLSFRYLYVLHTQVYRVSHKCWAVGELAKYKKQL